MIKDFEFYHGAALARLLSSGEKISFVRFGEGRTSAYIVNESVGLYLKYSTKRMAPWSFSFARDHQLEIDSLSTQCQSVVVGLVCHDDGIVALEYPEFRSILDEFHEPTEWIRVTRKAREKYSVSGKDGKLNYKVGEVDFIRKVLNS